MNKEFYTKHGEWLIPVLCVLVVFQSVMLFSDQAKTKVAQVTGNLSLVNNQEQITVPETAAAKIELATDFDSTVINKPVKVQVWLNPTRSVNLGGMDLVFKFDPKMARVTQVSAEKVFSLVLPNRQSESNGRLYITYLDESDSGVLVDQRVLLATLTLVPKQTGNLKISLISSAVGATTILTEKVSSEPLPFTVNDLSITVTEE